MCLARCNCRKPPFLGRAWNLGTNITYGQYGGLANLNFTDPWIYGDKHRTRFSTSVFLSQQVPQVFQSEDNGNIRTAKDYVDNGSNKAYETGRSLWVHRRRQGS